MHRHFHLDKVIRVMVGITLLQTAGVAVVTILMFASPEINLKKPELAALLLLVLTSIAGSLLALTSVRPMIRFGSKLKQTESSIADLSTLNNKLRAQRHDFLNHLQVVYSLMELKEYEEAEHYIEKVYVDIQKISRVLKTGIPAVNAILQAKAQMCESRDIHVDINVQSSLSDIAIPDWEFCRVLGNIIDNAIHALLESEMPGEKHLTIELSEDIKAHSFRISNNGPEIPLNLRHRIFEPGFSTRSERGDGMGLAICSALLAKYRGTLKVTSDASLTVFEGSIPRRMNTETDTSH